MTNTILRQLAAVVASTRGWVQRAEREVRVPVTPNVPESAWPGFDLDAVKAAGERAELAVRAAQQSRRSRRHLSVVA